MKLSDYLEQLFSHRIFWAFITLHSKSILKGCRQHIITLCLCVNTHVSFLQLMCNSKIQGAHPSKFLIHYHSDLPILWYLQFYIIAL